jgi:hypothetical protein
MVFLRTESGCYTGVGISCYHLVMHETIKPSSVGFLDREREEEITRSNNSDSGELVTSDQFGSGELNEDNQNNNCMIISQ